jgi:hypothetical protein
MIEIIYLCVLNALNIIKIRVDNFIYNKIIDFYLQKYGFLYVKILVSPAMLSTLKGLRRYI